MADVVKVSLRLPRELAQGARIKALLADVPLEAVMASLLRGWVGDDFLAKIRQVVGEAADFERRATEANGGVRPAWMDPPSPRKRSRGKAAPAEGSAQG